jgi:hypothetical protein
MAARTDAPQDVTAPQKLYMENTLLRVAGAVFCHDQKRARARTALIELDRGLEGKRITVRPDPEYGQPGPLAHKVFIALMRKHSAYGRPAPREISFRQRELARLVGREWSSTTSRQFVRALQEIHHTFVRTSFQGNGKDVWHEHSFNIFPEIIISRRTENSPIVEACVVALAEPVLASLRDSHFTCLNYSLMNDLGTIGQALYMRLFFHFANLSGEVGKARLSVTKRYDDICAEWLGGLTILRFRSDIERDQMGPHLRQLCDAGFLAAYSIDRIVGGEGWKLTFRPGPTFFADYDRYYRRRAQGELQWDFQADQQDLHEPLQAVRLFMERRMRKPLSGFASVSDKDTEAARAIIAGIGGFEAFPSFLDFALNAAARTNFQVRFLAGLKQYVDDYIPHKNKQVERVAAAAAMERRQQEEAEEAEYSRFHRIELERIFQELSSEERASLKADVAPLKSGPLSKGLTKLTILSLIETRYSDRLTKFEKWRTLRANPGTLTREGGNSDPDLWEL